MSPPRDPCVNVADAVSVDGRSRGREMALRRLHRGFLQGEGNRVMLLLLS